MIKFIQTLSLLAILHGALAAQNFSLIGFATLNGGTTGGAGGQVVMASTLAQLQQYVESTTPYIIKITAPITGGTATVPVILRPKSNKTIVGIDTLGKLKYMGFYLRNVKNIIIRNVQFSLAWSDDLLSLEDALNVWVDHCEFFNVGITGGKDDYDGLFDAKGLSQYITVSWCYFHDHWKGCLWGFTDSGADPDDRKTTFHHNYFRNINSRMPSYRYGTGHIFNNYFADVPSSGSGINSRMGACLRIERNVFERVKEPITSVDSPLSGFWDVSDNQFISCTGSQPTVSNCSFSPTYAYSNAQEPTSTVKNTVMQWAGIGKIDPLSTPIAEIAEKPIFQILGNPSSDFLQIKILDTYADDNLTLSIFDSLGKLVFIEKTKTVAPQLNIQFLLRGVYWLEIGDGKGHRRVDKFVKL